MTSNRENTPSSLDARLAFVKPTGEERLVNWLTEYGRTLLALIGVAFLLVLIGYIWQASSKGKTESDYLAAQNALEQLKHAIPGEPSPKDLPALATLQEQLSRHPELSSRYNGAIAQQLLRLGDPQLALGFADQALKQLAKENLPLYEEFSKTSILISQGNYKEAHKRAAFLQKHLAEQDRNDLLAFNQVRIAALLQQLKQPAEEKKAWQEVQSLESSPIIKDLQVGTVSYSDYIRSRLL